MVFAEGQNTQKSRKGNSLGMPLQPIFWTRFARVCEDLNLWCYHVCIVCVSKIFETAKDKVLKDAEKSNVPCTALIPLLYIAVFCITGAKLMVLFGMDKK